VRSARLLPFIISRKTTNVFVSVELRRRIDLMTSRTKLRLPEKGSHYRTFVARNVCQNLFVGEITKERSPIFFSKQRRSANGEAARAVQPCSCN